MVVGKVSGDSVLTVVVPSSVMLKKYMVYDLGQNNSNDKNHLKNKRK